MPAEKIPDAESGYRRVTVGWGGPDGDVTVSTEWHTDLLATHEGLTPDEVEQRLSEPADGNPRGWRINVALLDRDGINRMIRALRKARDAKFGRDE